MRAYLISWRADRLMDFINSELISFEACSRSPRILPEPSSFQPVKKRSLEASCARRRECSASGTVRPASQHQTVFLGTSNNLPNSAWVLVRANRLRPGALFDSETA